VAADIGARLAGTAADPLAADYPRVEDGARGVRFIEKTVQSAASEHKWTAMGSSTPLPLVFGEGTWRGSPADPASPTGSSAP
jgi:hypothetical protein